MFERAEARSSNLKVVQRPRCFRLRFGYSTQSDAPVYASLTLLDARKQS